MARQGHYTYYGQAIICHPWLSPNPSCPRITVFASRCDQLATISGLLSLICRLDLLLPLIQARVVARVIP